MCLADSSNVSKIIWLKISTGRHFTLLMPPKNLIWGPSHTVDHLGNFGELLVPSALHCPPGSGPVSGESPGSRGLSCPWSLQPLQARIQRLSSSASLLYPLCHCLAVLAVVHPLGTTANQIMTLCHLGSPLVHCRWSLTSLNHLLVPGHTQLDPTYLSVAVLESSTLDTNSSLPERGLRILPGREFLSDELFGNCF